MTTDIALSDVASKDAAATAANVRRHETTAAEIDPGKLLRLKLIGPMEAWTVGAENVLPLGRKTRALLAVLALSAPRPVARARLAELLWSRRPEEPARASLRQEVHRLMESLQPVHADLLIPSRDRIAINADLVWVDVECLLRTSVQEPAGLALLNAEVLDGFDGLDPAFDSWLVAERERIRDKVRSIAETILRASAEPEPTIAAAKQLLSLDKAHEGAWRALMLAYTALGERGLAIQAYEQCRAALANLLSANPSPETQRLVAEIRGGAALEPDANQAGLAPLGTIAATRPCGPKFGAMPLRLAGQTSFGDIPVTSVEDVTAALDRFRWINSVSVRSLGQFGSRDPAAVRQTFGLDFLLDGSAQRVGDTRRISLQLLDLRDAAQLIWAYRLDQPADDLSGLSGVSGDVAAQLDAEMLLREAQHASGLPADQASAYDLTVQAVPLIARLARDDFERAGCLLGQAIERDPEFAAAHAWRAYWLAFAVGQSWAPNPQAALFQAGQHADRALALDPQDARSLAIIGHVRAFVHQQPREALKFHERALVLNPNLPMAWGFAAVTYTYLGDLEEATRRFERYQRLAQVDYNAFVFASAMGLLAFAKRDYADAIRLGRRCSELNPGFSAGLKHYLAALGQAGQSREAAAIRARLLAIEPHYSVAAFLERCPFDRDSDREHYAEGLRRAGLE